MSEPIMSKPARRTIVADKLQTVRAMVWSWLRGQGQEQAPRTLALNRNTELLKIIAIVAMTCDHLGKMIFPYAPYLSLAPSSFSLFPSVNVLRLIGRLAMPLFMYCMAVGCAYTRHSIRYILRLISLAIVVQPLYATALGYVEMGAFDWLHDGYRLDVVYDVFYAGKHLNILFTLALGCTFLSCLRHRRYVLAALVFGLVEWAHSQLSLDYGRNGIYLMLLFYLFLDRPLASFVWVASFMLYWAMPNLGSDYFLRASAQIYALLALPLIYLPLRSRWKLPKSLFYLYYPAHLGIIYGLRWLLTL